MICRFFYFLVGLFLYSLNIQAQDTTVYSISYNSYYRIEFPEGFWPMQGGIHWIGVSKMYKLCPKDSIELNQRFGFVPSSNCDALKKQVQGLNVASNIRCGSCGVGARVYPAHHSFVFCEGKDEKSGILKVREPNGSWIWLFWANMQHANNSGNQNMKVVNPDCSQ